MKSQKKPQSNSNKADIFTQFKETAKAKLGSSSNSMFVLGGNSSASLSQSVSITGDKVQPKNHKLRKQDEGSENLP